MIAHITTPIPGPNSRKYKSISATYESHCLNVQAPIVWDRAQGVQVWDVDGNSFIDWTSGVLVTNVGHSHTKLAGAIAEQAKRLLNCYDFPTPERVTLAERMVKLAPDNLDNAFFATMAPPHIISFFVSLTRPSGGLGQFPESELPQDAL